MIPTEHEMTVAVDAAARHAWETHARQFERTEAYEALGPLEQNALREQALGPIVAALEAIPDRAPAAAAAVGAEVVRRLTTVFAVEVVQARLVHDRACRAISSLEDADCECDLHGTARAVLSGLVVGVLGDLRVCRVCGCTQDRACSPPCYWVDADLCSSCRSAGE
jgi:hypothetical protein